MKDNCEYHNKKATYECEECGTKFCTPCEEINYGECPECPLPRLKRIKKVNK